MMLRALGNSFPPHEQFGQLRHDRVLNAFGHRTLAYRQIDPWHDEIPFFALRTRRVVSTKRRLGVGIGLHPSPFPDPSDEELPRSYLGMSRRSRPSGGQAPLVQ